jgi:hypothetical protein
MCIAPTVEQVHACSADRSKETLRALYDVGLDLLALGFFSEAGAKAELVVLWREVFPRVASLIAVKPREVIGSLSNAALYLSQLSDSKTEKWLAMMRKLGPECRSPEQLLLCGQFLAWVAGMAHLRSAAIELAMQLPPQILNETLGMPVNASETETRSYLDLAKSDPWVLPIKTHGIREVGRVGNFRGLGGQFLSTPKTYLADGTIHVTDGHKHWRLFADRFGHTLRTTMHAPKPTPLTTHSNPPTIDEEGSIRWRDNRIHRSDLSHVSSQCFDGCTLAVTIMRSFHVFLFSRQG